jgi:hypothetical protein
MAATDTHATTEAVFSVRPVPGLYNDGQQPLEESLETAVRRGGWCEKAASLGVSGASWLVSELWDTVGIRYQATTGEGIANLEDFMCVVVRVVFGVCNLVRLS